MSTGRGRLDESEEGGMPGKRHGALQIVGALRRVEASKKVSEVCREMGVSQQMFYNWKRLCDGLGLKEQQELSQPGKENRGPKRIVVDFTLDKPSCRRCFQKSSGARKPSRDPIHGNRVTKQPHRTLAPTLDHWSLLF
jgi:putative transposase